MVVVVFLVVSEVARAARDSFKIQVSLWVGLG